MLQISRLLNMFVAMIIFTVFAVLWQALVGAAALLPAVLIQGVPGLLVLLVVAAVATPLSFFSSIPLVRYLVRVFPMRVNDDRRIGCVVLLAVLCPLLCIVGSLDGSKKVAPALTGMFFFLVFIGVAVSRYAAASSWRRRPFALYLRRFSSFSDRVVVRTLLESLPDGTPLVMLIPDQGGPRDWDPLTIGFAGFRLRQPLASMPVWLRSTNDWESDVRQLAALARCVVLDTTEHSQAMETELGLLTGSELQGKTLLIRDVDANWQLPSGSFSPLRYERSWASSTPRILLVLTACIALVLLSFVAPNAYPSVLWWGIPMLLAGGAQRSLTRSSRRELANELANRFA